MAVISLPDQPDAEAAKKMNGAWLAVMAAATAVQHAATMANQSAERLNRAGQNMEWTHYLLSVATGMVTAGLASAFWLWLAPPTVVNHLDAAQVAEYLRPAIEALKPSKHK